MASGQTGLNFPGVGKYWEGQSAEEPGQPKSVSRIEKKTVLNFSIIYIIFLILSFIGLCAERDNLYCRGKCNMIQNILCDKLTCILYICRAKCNQCSHSDTKYIM